MRPRIGFLLVFAATLSAVPAFSDDQQKAEKQIRKISAMATDVNARSIVSRSMSDMLKVERNQLQRERRAMNLNYGCLFIAHELTARGMKMLDVAMRLQAHETIFQIANEQHADWKKIADDAKKLNGRIEDNIYKHFLHADADRDRDLTDKYDSTADWVKTDADATPAEIVEAQEIYVQWRDRAAAIEGKGGSVSASDKLASQKLEDQAHDVGRMTGRAPTGAGPH
jgi:hypothetical protein